MGDAASPVTTKGAETEVPGGDQAPDADIDIFSLFSQIDFKNWELQAAILAIILAPTIWNIVARTEFRTRFMRKVTGSKYVTCYILAVWIFCFSSFRDHLVREAILAQPNVSISENLQGFATAEQLRYIGVPFTAIGSIFVMGSFWRLGITGTFLGDYCGILMDEMVEGFPFNVVSNPMYTGSTLNFLGMSLWYDSVVGLTLTWAVFICYQIALLFEGPFTTYIYANRHLSEDKPLKKRN